MDNNNKKKLQLQFNINNNNNNNTNNNKSNINKPTTSKNYNNNNNSDDQDNKINDNCNIKNDIYKVNNDNDDNNETGGGGGGGDGDDDDDDKKYERVNKKNEILNKKLVKSNLINDNKCNNVTIENVCEEKLPLIDKEKDKLHVQFESNSLIVPPIAAPLKLSTAIEGSNHPSIITTTVGIKGSSSTSTATPDSLISSTNSEDDEDENSSIEIRPPDGGWGWVVVFASFMINLIADGITFSFGIIYIEFLSYFGEGKAKTAWIGSLFMAMPLLSGPFASFLTDRYGCRKVTIAGSLLAALGFIISSFSNSMEMLFITFGIMSGFGLSLCYVAAVVIVAYYFDKKRSFATGLSVCGSGIGTFIFAPLTNYLIKEYGWRGTTLILAGAFLHMTVCGMLMRDLEWTTHSAKKRRAKLANLNNNINNNNNLNKKNNIDDTFILNDSINNINSQNYTNNNNNNNNSNIKNIINNIDDSRLFSSLITLPTFIKYDSDNKVPTEIMDLLSSQQTNNINQFLLKNYPNLLNSRSFSEPLSRCTLSPNDNFNNVTSPTNVLALHEEDEDGNGDDDDYEQQKDNEEQQDDNDIKENKQMRNNRNKKILVANHNEQVFSSWLRRNGGTHCTTNQRDHRIPHSSFLKDLRMHRHSLTYRGAMLNINRYRLRASSCPDIYRNSMTTIAKEKTQWYHGINEFKNSLIDILDFSYFADMRFFLFALSNFLLYTWYDVPYVYLADNAVEKGLSIQEASMLISIIGIVNMFGEILLGWVGDRKNINATYVYAVCMALCGIVTGLIPLLSNYYPLSFVSGAFGLFIAANYSLTSIILVELITIERFTNAYGLLLLVQGIANLIGPPLGGHIYDVTGSYDLSFYLSGLFIAFSGVLFIILPIVNKYKKYINNNNDIKNLTNDKLNIDPEVSNITQKPLENNKILIKNCFNNDNSVKVNHV